ncbi:hypothetical protein QBC37DRAFT_355914 [Rhypophila decipiens]|uniref:Uncharacterized protein n=1 Tax=Rhypophila decipiens TaxID=261697 RepID=A0AAN6XUX1_9PEZI|nr:hypothetical protein QBC37DRAFT_355914 [Rhypophila decipiens]
MSRCQPFVCFLLILCLVQAATSSLNICVKDYEAKYDELHWEEPFETGNPISDGYKGLDYNVFQVDRYDGFINPDSGLQYAMSFGGSGNISVHDGRRHSFFSLKSFSYACSGGVPQPECAISMWGFRGGSLVAHQVITYPALEPGHFISEFIMNSTFFDWRWAHLSSVGFAIARADNGGTLYGGLMIDDFRYSVESECNNSCS